MNTLRRILRGPAGRVLTSGLVAATLHISIDPQNYLYALEVERKKEADIRAIAAKMNVDPEFLLNPQGRTRFDFRTLFRQIGERLGLTSQASLANEAQPPEIRESIQRVKERYALVAADTILARIAELVQVSLSPENVREKKKGQIKAELQSVLRLIDKDFLPAVKDGAPGAAKSRDAQMRKEIKELQKRVKSVINQPHALEEANLEATLAQLRNAVSGTLTVRNSKPRWTRDPFPVKDTYRVAPSRPAGPSYDDDSKGAGATSPAVVTQSVPSTTSASLRPATNSVSGEVTALANTLATPAKIFAWVHDNIDWESYSGVAKGSLGTLQERRGNDWDQALLLRDLLAARGYDARLEWGRVTLPVAKAMNLVGTEDPLQAANLLATAGFDGLVLTAQSQPIAIQMTHVWVRAHIPYIPNRGATAGTPDTWVRMDPSFKRYEYQPGIAINGKVAWNEDEYLQTSAIRPPADFYGAKIWNYIRTNNIDCVNLSQVTKAGRIRATNFPFVPATLTTRIDSVGGVAAAAPAEQMQSVTMNVTDINGAVMASYTTSLADLWGKKLSITFPPATPDDAATIAAYGGLFNTPAYLIKLKPVFSIDDQPVADGSAVPAGAVLDLNTTFRQPNVADDFTHHELVAGETHALVFDPGAFPDSLLEARINRLKTLTQEDAVLSEKLFLVGLRYMQHVDDGIAFSTGVRWQRPVKRVFEADVRRQIDITYNVAGAAIRLNPAENNIDVSRLLVGIVPINNDQSNRASALALAGLQSSYLEGAIWEEMESQQGISAVKALLLARMAGQQIHTVNASNVNAVLNAVNLSADVEAEIRGAVAQGRIAKIPSANLQVNRWNGTGYILQDSQTGAATYPISGGLAGGSTTGVPTREEKEPLGEEVWLERSDFPDLFHGVLSLLGISFRLSKREPSAIQSDPVNMGSGNMYRVFNDLSIPATGIPISVTRTYNSRSTYSGPFGHGWTFTYDERLIDQNSEMLYREADGTEHSFLRASDGSFVSPPGKYAHLSATAGGHAIAFNDGTVYVFDDSGRLTTQTDRNGNRVTIQRDAGGRVVSVTDALSRIAVTFAYVGEHIVQVTDLAGRTVSYEYAGDDLVAKVGAGTNRWTYEYDLAHNLTGVVDPAGARQSYDYDIDDRLFQHTDSIGGEEFFQYDIAGGTSVLTDRRGGDLFLQFDEEGRVTREVDAAGNEIRATWDASNNPIALVDSVGNTTTYTYDASGNVTRQATPDGAVVTATYDSFSNPLTVTDANGAQIVNGYDSEGNLLQTSRTVAGTPVVVSNEYDGAGRLLKTTDGRGGSTSFTWNAAGAVASLEDAAGNTTSMTTDSLGRLTQIKDPAGNVSSKVWDANNNVVSSTDLYGITTTHIYDALGRELSTTTLGGTTRRSYDTEGRLLTTTSRDGSLSRRTYNLAGDLIQSQDARGNITRFVYDPAGRVTKMIDANGGTWTYSYCGSIGGSVPPAACATCGGGASTGRGAFCDVTDPAGNRVHKEFDSMGRVVAVTDALSHTVVTQYDNMGRKTSETDANGKVRRFAYDEVGRLVTQTAADGSVVGYGYDRNGNRTSRRDENGHLWTFAYDAVDRLVEEKDPLGRKTTYTHDVLGNIKTKTDGNNQTIVYTYAVRRLTKVSYPDGSSDNYVYDAQGRRMSAANGNVTYTYTYDAQNRVTSVMNSRVGFKSTYEYDAVGNRSRLITPQSTVQYAYDAKNRLTTMTDTLFGVFRFTYDEVDRRTELHYPNGIKTSYAYDNAHRLTAVVAKDGAGSIVDTWSYQYDAVGNRIAKANPAGTAETYRYDDTYRLIEAVYPDNGAEKFTYDPSGNRLTRTTESGAVTAYSYDDANQLQQAGSETFSYDGKGNMITRTAPVGVTRLTYDVKDQVTSISTPGGTETNRYGPTGERMEMAGASIEGGLVRPQYDLSGNPITDSDGSNGIWTHRLYAPGVDEPLAEWRRTNNRITYLHRDGLGSVTAVTTASGQLAYRQSYTAFGTMSRTADPSGITPTRLGFTSRETSVGSLIQYRARYYDSSLGRFTSVDPGREGNLPSSQQYIYVLNRPVNYTDPTGRVPIPYQGIPNALLTCEQLLEKIIALMLDIEERLIELKENKKNQPDFKAPGTKGRGKDRYGHAVQIENEQIALLRAISDYVDKCGEPPPVPQEDLEHAALTDPLEVGWPSTQPTATQHNLWWNLLMAAGVALLLIIALLLTPEIIVAYCVVGLVIVVAAIIEHGRYGGRNTI